MKHEYDEGPEAKERFEKTMKALFRVPKSSLKPTAKPVKKAAKGRKASTARGDKQS